MTSLADWMRKRNLTHHEFAGLIGAERSAVTRYASGERTPRPETMRRIAEVTGGEVTANDFVAAAGVEPAGATEDEAA